MIVVTAVNWLTHCLTESSEEECCKHVLQWDQTILTVNVVTGHLKELRRTKFLFIFPFEFVCFPNILDLPPSSSFSRLLTFMSPGVHVCSYLLHYLNFSKLSVVSDMWPYAQGYTSWFGGTRSWDNHLSLPRKTDENQANRSKKVFNILENQKHFLCVVKHLILLLKFG